jgi:two-component system response regulator AtoC
MQSIFKLSAKVALYDTTILITGESGTGKELIARGIHFSGKRSDKPLIPVNCGSIPENLIESEFFGHIKGAFTGADKNRKGLFEAADKGTIFLDEVGELPLTMQVKLLRVLQENEIRPVGDSKSREIDVRVIGATSLELEEEVKKGNFREDLFYRLNVLSIKLPPLRNRTEDIPLLCNLFIERYNNKLEKDIQGISSKALSILLEHYWPGNIRELENTIERAVLLAEESILLPDNFPPEIGVKSVDLNENDIFNIQSLKVAKEIIERKLITKVLKETGGNRTKASKLLEISHPSLLSKIKSYNIEE